MRVKKTYELDEFQPWGGAVATWRMIEEYSSIEVFGEWLDSACGEEIDETTLNDLLWFESDWILQSLEILGYDEELKTWDFLIEWDDLSEAIVEEYGQEALEDAETMTVGTFKATYEDEFDDYFNLPY